MRRQFRPACAMWRVAALGHGCATLSAAARTDFARVASLARQEARTNADDIKDIASAARAAAAQLQAVRQKHGGDGGDAKARAKLMTLAASMKTYAYRLSNLEAEARSIVEDAEAVLNELGTQQGGGGGGAAAPTPSGGGTAAAAAKAAAGSADRSDFTLDSDFTAASPTQQPVEPPAGAAQTPGAANRARAPTRPPTDAEQLAKHPPGAGAFAEASAFAAGSNLGMSGGDEELKVDFVRGDEPPKAAGTGEIPPQDIEVEPIDPIDEKSVTEITEELYNKGVDFSDCRDAKALRQRYKDVQAGKFQPKKAATPPPPPPPRSNPYTPPPPNTSEKGLAQDPHPGSQRKMVDPNRLVGDLKLELSRENNLSPHTIGLFCAGVRMDETKRVSDYPQVQYHQIEIRTV